MSAPRPWNLIAELTYRCPLRCPYCSNPLDWSRRRDGLDTAGWMRVMREAAALGVVHVGLTGGEPSLRPDLEEITAAASGAGLYTLLVTAGVGLDDTRLDALAAAGLRSVQLSIQDPRPDASDRIAGTRSFDEKIAFARRVRARGWPLVLNVVLHRHNLDQVREIVDLARRLDVERLELANTQYHGWAWRNRAALLPGRAQVEAAAAAVREARREARRPEIVFVLPDWFSDRPKPCMGGWGRTAMVVTPEGRVQPCHEASILPDLEFWSAVERPLAECWGDAPGMRAFRGEAWMREPCRSCPERARDFAGCRCQAWRLAGDAAAADPACALSPARARLERAREEASADPGSAPWVPRGVRGV